MSIEAMKQALEALDEAANVLTSRMFADSATALRDAIEQAGEPVAYRWKGELFTPGEIEMLDVTEAVPLYEHPRQWVGLTDEDIDNIELPPSGTATVRDLVRLIEAKLKAKNEAP